MIHQKKNRGHRTFMIVKSKQSYSNDHLLCNCPFYYGPYAYTTATTRTKPVNKMCFYLTLEFRIYLELFSVSVGIKSCFC